MLTAQGASCVLMKTGRPRGLRLGQALHPPITEAGVGGALPCHTEHAAAEVANDQTPHDGRVTQAEPRNTELLFVTTII